MMMAVVAIPRPMRRRALSGSSPSWRMVRRQTAGAMPISAPSQRSMRASASHQVVMFMGFFGLLGGYWSFTYRVARLVYVNGMVVLSLCGMFTPPPLQGEARSGTGTARAQCEKGLGRGLLCGEWGRGCCIWLRWSFTYGVATRVYVNGECWHGGFVATRFVTPPPRVPLKKASAFFKGKPRPSPASQHYCPR